MDRPHYLAPTDVDELARMTIALAQEVWVMRDRMAIMERLLAERCDITAAQIDNYAGDAAFKAEVATLRERFAGRVLGAPLAARERSVDAILARAGLPRR
jgi:hypothetical protein